MAFRDDSEPIGVHKRSIEMTQTDATGRVTRRARPAAQILLRDAPEPSFKAVRRLDDERFALAWGGPYAASKTSVEVRRLADLKRVAHYAKAAAPIVVRGSRMLAGGPLCAGQAARTRILDLSTKSLVAELPVAEPFALAASGAVFARIRRKYDFETDPIAPPALVAQFPELKQLIDADGGVLVKVTEAGTVELVVTEQELAPVYAELRGLALSPDEGTLYYAGARSIGAYDLRDRRTRWVHHLGANAGEHFVSLYRLALSGDGARLAIGGRCGHLESTLRVYDAACGAPRFELAAGSVDALTFHGHVLIAGTSEGALLLVDETYARRELRAASAGINDVDVIGGGVLCACNQRQLRFVPLLDDETDATAARSS